MKHLPGTILRVDLNSGKIERQPMSEDLRLDFVGGRGINAKILFDEVGPAVAPLSSENRLIFGAGLLSGTTAPCPARFNVSAKSPLTGIMGDSNAGGNFGPALRKAGVDNIVFVGKADGPVYLWIENGRVEIRPAHHLWGKNIKETEAAIKEELGDKRVRVAAIGQAGEHLVKIANVVHEERSASRTGVGAVMGSKNLKAVAVRGTGEVQLFDREGFNRVTKQLNRRIAESKEYERTRTHSGWSGTYSTDKVGFLAVRNFEKAGGFEQIDNYDPDRLIARYFMGNLPCFGCPIGCGKKWEIKDGPFAGERGNKCEEGAVSPLGPVCGNGNTDSVFKMNNMANQMGIDTLEFGQAMAVVMEWYEKGIVTEKDLDGLSMTWGNYEAMMKMMEKVAFRHGIGDILAEGIVRAAPKFGKEAVKCVSHCKGMTMGGIEPRVMKGSALGFATNTRGACHLRSLVPVEFSPYPVMTLQEAEAKFGTSEVLQFGSYKKAAALIYYQHVTVIPDLLEVCRFLFGLGAGTKTFTYDNLLELYELATGIEVDEKSMLTIGERVFNVERAFSCREGMGRKEDHLVGKWVDGPVPSGPFKGDTIDPVKWEGMLDEYYRLRGWDSNGVPTGKKLTELGLKDVADKLGV